MVNIKKFGEGMDRSVESEKAYRIRARSVLRRYIESRGDVLSDPLCFSAVRDVDGFLDWMRAYRNGVSSSSWRQIRAAVSFSIEHGVWQIDYPEIASGCIYEQREGGYKNFTGVSLGFDDIREGGYKLEFGTRLPDVVFPSFVVIKASDEMYFLSDAVREISTEGCREARGTSSKKKKSISDEEIVELTKYFGNTRDTESKRSAYEFLIANLVVGLRPGEWMSVSLLVNDQEVDVLGFDEAKFFADREAGSEDVIKMRVKNAKASNSRSHGQYRTLTLESGLQGFYREKLFSHWRRVAMVLASADQEGKNHDVAFDEFYSACRSSLNRVVKQLWPSKQKRIALYSSRHQAMADSKNALTLPEIAALYGHATDRTASEHYGRKKYGKGSRCVVSADEEEVSRIRRVPNNWVAPERTSDISRNK